LLKNSADVRTVLYMVAATAVLIINWNLAAFSLPLFLVACFFGVSASVMAHNHTHAKMWTNKYMNIFQDYWITVFYGFPVFAWIPTHNRNHHRYTNKPGDRTATWLLSEKNNMATLLSYPTFSGLSQQPVVRDFLQQQWTNNRKRFWYCISQYVVLAAWIGTALYLDWQKALLYVIIPGQVGLFTVLIFNYVQHIHADEESEYNHSRNIVGFWLNAMLFNNGYHTIHHMKPYLHWSELPAAHAEIAQHIHPSLNEKSFWGYMFRVYVLGLFDSRYRTDDMRAARMASEAVAAK
jgi:fatty acid desaturase